MYVFSVVLLLLILPAAAVIVEAWYPHSASIIALIGKWYVFWAGGVRLLLAGMRQMSQPRFTAAEIFNLDNVKAFPIVREIGFANLAMGALESARSFALRGWFQPLSRAVCIMGWLDHLCAKNEMQMKPWQCSRTGLPSSCC
jgi:hypothetical protein